MSTSKKLVEAYKQTKIVRNRRMLNYKSVRSSEAQIRSNPALRHIHPNSGFQKRIPALLEPTPLPFPTFQIVKEASQSTLQQHQYHAWVRPAHLRAQWLILADGLPLLMMDPRDSNKLWSIRVPFDKFRVQHIGPIVLEGAWDAQDHILWIWDVVVWEKQTIWNTMPYSKRWELVKTTVSEILDCGHPMSDAEVKVPQWESLSNLLGNDEFDPAMSIEFQPEKAGQRRQLLLIRDEGVKFRPTTYAERKMVSETKQTCAIQIDGDQEKSHMNHTKHVKHTKQPSIEERAQEITKQPVNETPQQTTKPVYEDVKATLCKDTFSKLPDTYRVFMEDGKDKGLAAIRSLGMSKELRDLFKTSEKVNVIVRWYEPFQKYEVRQIDN